MTVPARFGGADVRADTLAEIFRLLAAADASLAQIPQSHFVYVNVLRRQGTDEQQEFFFGEVLAGKRFGNAQSEAGTQHVQDIRTRLARLPDGSYDLDGVKHYSTGALFAHWIPVLARTEDDTLHVAYVPRDAPGLTVAQRTAAPTASTITADQSLTGRRVLVLGGSHDEAVEARARAVVLGASAAVNLSAGVTDVVVLPGGETDRRMTRITALGLRVHDADWLLAPAPAPTKTTAGNQPDSAVVLVRGAVLDLSDTGTPWTVAATWRQQTDCDVDVVAFAVDARRRRMTDRLPSGRPGFQGTVPRTRHRRVRGSGAGCFHALPVSFE